MQDGGIFGMPLGTIASFVVLFLIFGAFLEETGTGRTFTDLALGAFGSKKGGPAKAAVVGSAFFGMLSGSSVANVTTTGTFTIPLMKKVGYESKFAGGVEACASTGGMFTPPIMGATAFVVAAYLGLPYLDVALAAAIQPAAHAAEHSIILRKIQPMNKQCLCAGAALGALLLSGCATSGGGASTPIMPSVFGHTQTVSVVDSSERIKLDTKVTLSDIIAFAENLTNKMLASPVIANAKKPPRIVVGTLRQNTHDENLRVQDIQDRIQEVLFNSGTVRVLDSSATSFDYIMRAEITDIVTRAPDGQKLVDYTMKIKLFTLDGELKGQWSDDLSLFKSR